MTVQELYESIGGNYENAKKILQMDKLIGKFIQKLLTNDTCEKLVTACESMDGAALFEQAHAMKGICANLGLDSLSAKASEIAENYRPGNTPTLSDDEVRAKVSDIKADFDHAVEEIKKYAAEQ